MNFIQTLMAMGFVPGQYDYADTPSFTKEVGGAAVHIVTGHYNEPGDGTGELPTDADEKLSLIVYQTKEGPGQVSTYYLTKQKD